MPDLEDRYFFVSGPPSMVDSLAQMLSIEVGIQPDRLIHENFIGYE